MKLIMILICWIEVRKNGSVNHKNLQTALSLGGREIVTFIQYGHFLEVDIEIQG